RDTVMEVVLDVDQAGEVGEYGRKQLARVVARHHRLRGAVQELQVLVGGRGHRFARGGRGSGSFDRGARIVKESARPYPKRAFRVMLWACNDGTSPGAGPATTCAALFVHEVRGRNHHP